MVIRSFVAVASLLLVAPAAGAGTLVNPSATQTTVNLYNYLASLPGKSSKRVISGQEVGNGNPSYNVYSSTQGYRLYIGNLTTTTGILVGLAGFDYSADPTPAYHFPQITQTGVLQAVNNDALNHWTQGGIVTIMFGANNPWTGGASGDTNTNGHRLTDAITPGTAAYSLWIAQLDAVATALGQLQDAGVPVLWRPLHEMNGAWFWWGSPANPQDYKDLWQHMFNYLTHTKGLNNLIWVYAASSGANNAPNTVNTYYPGGNFVDIVGVDGYKDSIDAAIIASYNNLLLNGKPFALTEYGPATPPSGTLSTAGTLDYATLIAGIKTSLPQTSYFMTWADCPTCNPRVYWSMVGNRNAGTLLSDPWVVNASDLPSFASAQGSLTLLSGWNLLGNSVNAPLTVASSWLADGGKIASVWKWDAAKQNWAYFGPGQADGGAIYAAARGYTFLTTINAGEGFWVNASQAFTAQLPSATTVTSASMGSLPSGWNLIAVGDNPTPTSFNLALGSAEASNFTALWAWDSAAGKWYFYAPSLQALGSRYMLDYINQHGYLDFASFGKTLQPGTGFWLNRP